MADLRYRIGFEADTSQLQASVSRAVDQLKNLKLQDNFTAELQQASNEAIKLANHLSSAFNQKTGQLDLRVFNDKLKQSGKTLDQYYSSLVKLGPAGQRAFLSVAQSVTRAQLPIKQTSVLMNKLWVTMQNTARWRLSSAVLMGFSTAIQNAFSYAQDLNKSLNNIRIVTGKSAEEMAKFAKYANNAAKDLSTTTTKYTDASLIYFQQGRLEILLDKIF